MSWSPWKGSMPKLPVILPKEKNERVHFCGVGGAISKFLRWRREQKVKEWSIVGVFFKCACLRTEGTCSEWFWNQNPTESQALWHEGGWANSPTVPPVTTVEKVRRNSLGRDRRVLWPDSSEHHGNQVKSEKRKKWEGCWTGVHEVLECVIHSALFWVLSCRKQKHQYNPAWAKGSLYIEFWTVCYTWARGCNSSRKRRIGVFLNTHHHPPLPTPPHHQHHSHSLSHPLSLAPCQPLPPKVQSCWGQAYLILLFLGFQGQKKKKAASFL